MAQFTKFTLTAFGDEADAQLDRQMDVLDALGVHHIELRGVDGVNIASLSNELARDAARRMKARGFAASALGSPIGKYDITADFAPHLTQFKHVLELCDIFETQNIRVFSFFIPEGQAAKYRDEVMRRMEDLLDLAARANITLLHENEREIYGDTPERCLDLFEMLGTEGFWMTFDASNFVQVGADAKAAYELLHPYIRYMHIKDSMPPDKHAERDMGFQNVGDVHRPAGEGDGHVKWILGELIESDYEGFLSVEPHLPTCARYETGEQKMTAAVGALKGLLTQLGATWN